MLPQGPTWAEHQPLDLAIQKVTLTREGFLSNDGVFKTYENHEVKSDVPGTSLTSVLAT